MMKVRMAGRRRRRYAPATVGFQFAKLTYRHAARLKQQRPMNMEIAKALWQLSYATLIFAGYLLFMIFVAPLVLDLLRWFSHGTAFAGEVTCPSPFAVFTGIFLEVFGFGVWIAVASWIFGNPVQFR
jgi:hypothetical protein